MTIDPDAIDDDPVVRMPRTMVQPPPPPPPGVPARVVLMVGSVGATAGALLGAMGIAIVWATQPPPGPVARARRPRPAMVQRAVTNDPPRSFELDSDAGIPPRSADPTLPTGPARASVEVRQRAMGRGRTLADVLLVLNVPRVEVPLAVRAFRGLVNMRTLRPTDRVVTVREAGTHELQRVEYRRGPTEVWAALRENGQWRGERVEVTQRTARVEAGFRVQGSPEASVSSGGLEPDLLAEVNSIFAVIGLPPRLNEGDVLRVVLDDEQLNGQHFRYARVHGVDYRGAYGERRAYFLPFGRGGDWFDASGHTWERGPLRNPVPGARISSRFDPHRIHPVLHVPKPHNGMDFAAPTGTAVFAAADGRVLSVGPSGPSGNLVRVFHRALNVETGYAHLSRFAPGLRPGMTVRARSLIGYVGSTGRSTGAHLHFSVRRRGRFIDPMLLCGTRRAVPSALRADFESITREVGHSLDRVRVDGMALVAAPVAPPAVDAGSAPEHETEETEEQMDEGDPRERWETEPPLPQ